MLALAPTVPISIWQKRLRWRGAPVAGYAVKRAIETNYSSVMDQLLSFVRRQRLRETLAALMLNVVCWRSASSFCGCDASPG